MFLIRKIIYNNNNGILYNIVPIDSIPKNYILPDNNKFKSSNFSDPDTNPFFE